MSNYKLRITNYLVLGYAAIAICLLLYSFTQIDLGLTLTRISLVSTIQHAFQYVGYFNRPLSTGLYIFIVLGLSGLYCYALWKSMRKTKGEWTEKEMWSSIFILSIILLFSYNAFSYDIFNYIFDAKIVTYYHQNPYLYKALDFPNDPMLHFMRWTHRTYPYGPSWLIISVPLSYLGMQFFLPTLLLFKLLMIGSYLGTVLFIGKILEIVAPQKKLIGMAFFGLNPLIIIETLVSGHHDIVMLFFAVLAIYYLVGKKFGWSILLIAFSVGIKFATAFLVPVFLFLLASQRRYQWQQLFVWMSVLMIVPILLASFRTEMQPWYFLWVLPFIALSGEMVLMTGASVFSVGVLLTYVPILYTGNYDPPYATLKTSIIGASIVLAVLIGYICQVRWITQRFKNS